jgi:hypothetical protein
MTLNYPDVCQQALIEPWWEEYTGIEYRPGRLVWAYLPHADQSPYTLIPIGRADDPTDHETARVKIKPFSIGDPVKKKDLSVAALPLYENEKFYVYRTKKRPAVIISKGGPLIENELTRGMSKSRTVPTVLVAPSYGADIGYRKEFIERVRRCEYPQFIWDYLPIGGKEKGSIIRLDHMQPVVRSTRSIELTQYCLSEKAMAFVMQWIDWLVSGRMDQDSTLCQTREFLMEF